MNLKDPNLRATMIRWLGKMNGTAAKLDPAPDRLDPKLHESHACQIGILSGPNRSIPVCWIWRAR